MDSIPYGVIHVTGVDAFNFLQGQLSCDLRILTENPAPLLGAYCNHQGRIRALVHVSPIQDGYALKLPMELAEPILKPLKHFGKFSKVSFQILPESYPAERDEASAIEAAIPEILLATTEKILPGHIALEERGGLHLNKGCYVGQEILARMFYKSKTKIALARLHVPNQVLKPGDELVPHDVPHHPGVITVLRASQHNQSAQALTTMPLQYYTLGYTLWRKSDDQAIFEVTFDGTRC